VTWHFRVWNSENRVFGSRRGRALGLKGAVAKEIWRGVQSLGSRVYRPAAEQVYEGRYLESDDVTLNLAKLRSSV